jgi:hypothetical protein
MDIIKQIWTYQTHFELELCHFSDEMTFLPFNVEISDKLFYWSTFLLRLNAKYVFDEVKANQVTNAGKLQRSSLFDLK